MTTLSLLKSIEEIKSLKVRKLSIPVWEIRHPDSDWIRDQYLQWSQQMPVVNDYVDYTMLLNITLIAGAKAKKERVLSALKASEIIFYIDFYLKPSREAKSAQMAEEVVNNLIDALKSGRCDPDCHSG